jgi:hypothetical protein
MFKPMYRLYVKDRGLFFAIDIKSIIIGRKIDEKSLVGEKEIDFTKSEYASVNLFDIDNLVFSNDELIDNKPKFISSLNFHGYNFSKDAKPMIKYSGKNPGSQETIIRELELIFKKYPLLKHFANFLSKSKSVKDLEKDDKFSRFAGNFFELILNPDAVEFLINHKFIDSYYARFIIDKCEYELKIRQLTSAINALYPKIIDDAYSKDYMNHEQGLLVSEQLRLETEKNKLKADSKDKIEYSESKIVELLFSYLSLRKLVIGMDEYRKAVDRINEEIDRKAIPVVKRTFDYEELSTRDIYEMKQDGRLTAAEEQDIYERFKEKNKKVVFTEEEEPKRTR